MSSIIFPTVIILHIVLILTCITLLNLEYDYSCEFSLKQRSDRLYIQHTYCRVAHLHTQKPIYPRSVFIYITFVLRPLQGTVAAHWMEFIQLPQGNGTPNGMHVHVMIQN